MADGLRPRMIVLLGNTGSRYSQTRHNVGWMLADHLPLESSAWQQKFKAEWTWCTMGGEKLVVLKPHTMMNLSGESVQAAARFFRFDAEEIAVAHDDVELPFGEIGIRLGGGLAGHNGLRSVAHCMATPQFGRIRLGVGRPARGELHGYVIGRFTESEEAELPGILAAAAAMIEQGIRGGFATVPTRIVATEFGK